MLKELDTAIATRLIPLRQELQSGDILVRNLPDQIGEYGTGDLKGDVVALFKGGMGDKPNGGAVVQNGIETLRVLIELPNLFSPNGIYEVRDRLLSLLIGFKPPGARDKIYFGKWQFYREDSHWTVEMDFMVPVLYSEELTEEVAPLLEAIFYNDSDPFPPGVLASVGTGDLPEPKPMEGNVSIIELSDSRSMGLKLMAESGEKISAGQPIYVDLMGIARLAIATSETTASVDGIAMNNSIAGQICEYSRDGYVERSDWSGIAWQSNSLRPGVTYYLSPNVKGVITHIAPESEATGQYVAAVGRAKSTTALAVEIVEPILL